MVTGLVVIRPPAVSGEVRQQPSHQGRNPRDPSGSAAARSASGSAAHRAGRRRRRGPSPPASTARSVFAGATARTAPPRTVPAGCRRAFVVEGVDHLRAPLGRQLAADSVGDLDGTLILELVQQLGHPWSGIASPDGVRPTRSASAPCTAPRRSRRIPRTATRVTIQSRVGWARSPGRPASVLADQLRQLGVVDPDQVSSTWPSTSTSPGRWANRQRHRSGVQRDGVRLDRGDPQDPGTKIRRRVSVSMTRPSTRGCCRTMLMGSHHRAPGPAIRRRDRAPPGRQLRRMTLLTAAMTERVE